MDVTEYALFPTRLVAVQFPDADALNAELCALFDSGAEFAGDFDMHPDAQNLLSLADRVPAVARLRGMFLEGVRRWLAGQPGEAPAAVELVLFSNYARRGEFTLVHNHGADLVGVYYARTAPPAGPAVRLGEAADYFEAGDGVLVLHDPRFNANLAAVAQRDHVRVAPRPGLMLVFPGYLWHSVTPHLGGLPRLSFSMNVTLRWDRRSAAESHPWPCEL